MAYLLALYFTAPHSTKLSHKGTLSFLQSVLLLPVSTNLALSHAIGCAPTHYVIILQ